MSAIENIEANPSQKLRKPQQITNGMDFSQFFDSEMLTTVNLSQLSDAAPPRETLSGKTDINRHSEKHSTKHEIDTEHSGSYSKKDRNFQVEKSSDRESSPTEYLNGTRDYKPEEIRGDNNNNTSVVANDQINANASNRMDDNNLENIPSAQPISSQNKETPTAGVDKDSDGAAPDIQKIPKAGAVDSTHVLSHPSSLNSQTTSNNTSTNGSKIPEAVSSINKSSLSAENKGTSAVSIPNNTQVLISQQIDSGETFESVLAPSSKKTSEQKSSNAFGLANVDTTTGKKVSDIITASNNKTLLQPKALDTTRSGSTETQITQNPILKNSSVGLASTLNQSGLTENTQITAADVIRQSQSASPNDKGILSSSASKSLEQNKPQTETAPAIDRGNISPNLKNKNKIPGLKLSALEGDISIRVIDNNAATRTSNAAGNNILQAQNGAQTGDNNAPLSNRNGMTQPLIFTQHQVETSQSNLQTNNLKPLHLGANTGENNSSFNQNGSNSHPSNITSNTANQLSATPINGLETFKQHALKSDSSTNRPAETRTIGSASLSTQTKQPTAPNALAGVNSSNPQPTNSILGAQHPLTNSRPNAAPAATNQVSVQLSKAIRNGDNKIKIQLRPQELGRVEVKLEIANDGRAKAMILAERPETLDILQRDIRVLERALQDAGLKTDQNSLSFDLQGRKDNSNTQEASSQSSDEDTNPDKSTDASSLENDSDSVSAAAIGVTPDGSINLLT